MPVSLPAPADRECKEARRDEASGGEGCDAQRGAGRDDEPGSPKVADVHITDGRQELAGPDCNRQHFVDRFVYRPSTVDGLRRA